MSSLTTTAKELSGSESLTASCQTPQSLAISEHSLVKGTPQAIRAWLMLSQAVSPVSHSVTQANSLEQMIPATCGLALLTPFASYDHATACWRTSQPSLLTHTSELFKGIWPKAGIVCDGDAYRQPKWERRISEIGSGLWPTPTTRDWKSGKGAQKRDGHAQPLTDVIGGQLNPTWAEWLLGWPIGWTDLKPLGMDKYQQWLRQHGIY